MDQAQTILLAPWGDVRHGIRIKVFILLNLTLTWIVGFHQKRREGGHYVKAGRAVKKMETLKKFTLYLQTLINHHLLQTAAAGNCLFDAADSVDDKLRVRPRIVGEPPFFDLSPLVYLYGVESQVELAQPTPYFSLKLTKYC